jgi:hypothetical protein
MPAPPFKQHHSGGHRHVERTDRSCHRDSNQDVAVPLDEFVQSPAFTAQNEDGRPSVFGFGVELRAALVQSINPEAALLEVLQRLRHVAYSDHGQVFKRARGRLGNRFCQSRGSPLGYEHRVDSHGLCGANDGAEIVRIFHAIEHNQQLRARDRLVEIRVPVNGAKRNDALMLHRAGGGAIQGLAGLKAQRDRALTRQVNDFLQTIASGAACDQHPIEGAPGAQCFANRMDSGHDLGGWSGVARLDRRRLSGLMFRSYQCRKWSRIAQWSARMAKYARAGDRGASA